jgi:calcineurin-like phosphoesterase family protein
MSDIWFTSDCHYSHTNICGPSVSSWEKGYRDFDSVKDMNDKIIDSLSVIKPDDHLYYLGDWSFGGKENIKRFRERIPCENIYVTLGNHDPHLFKYRDLFESIHAIWEGKILDRYFFLHHYAQRVWNHSHKGSIHLYGHSHGTLPDDPNNQSMDVGWDTCLYGHEKYSPYHYDEIVAIMAQKGQMSVDHHNSKTT